MFQLLCKHCQGKLNCAFMRDFKLGGFSRRSEAVYSQEEGTKVGNIRKQRLENAFDLRHVLVQEMAALGS
jgi:hypothetical protein